MGHVQAENRPLDTKHKPKHVIQCFFSVIKLNTEHTKKCMLMLKEVVNETVVIHFMVQIFNLSNNRNRLV